MYLVSGGASASQTWAHISSAIEKKKFRVSLTNMSGKIGLLALQGPKRYVPHSCLMNFKINYLTFTFILRSMKQNESFLFIFVIIFLCTQHLHLLSFTCICPIYITCVGGFLHIKIIFFSLWTCWSFVLFYWNLVLPSYYYTVESDTTLHRIKNRHTK